MPKSQSQSRCRSHPDPQVTLPLTGTNICCEKKICYEKNHHRVLHLSPWPLPKSQQRKGKLTDFFAHYFDFCHRQRCLDVDRRTSLFDFDSLNFGLFHSIFFSFLPLLSDATHPHLIGKIIDHQCKCPKICVDGTETRWTTKLKPKEEQKCIIIINVQFELPKGLEKHISKLQQLLEFRIKIQ